jgi:hypothetical protein
MTRTWQLVWLGVAESPVYAGEPHPRQAIAVQQRIHERPGEMPRRGMHHHARRLVDHEQVLILIHHFQWDVLQINEDNRENFDILASSGIKLGF